MERWKDRHECISDERASNAGLRRSDHAGHDGPWIFRTDTSHGSGHPFEDLQVQQGVLDDPSSLQEFRPRMDSSEFEDGNSGAGRVGEQSADVNERQSGGVHESRLRLSERQFHPGDPGGSIR